MADHPSASLSAAKPAEDGNGIILRLYNSAPYALKTRIIFGKPGAKGELCDLLEAPVQTEAVWNAEAQELTLAPYSIETLRIV